MQCPCVPSSTSPVSLSVVIVLLKQVLIRFRIERVRSAVTVVTGRVAAIILRTTKMTKNSAVHAKFSSLK